ncbi:hypothetical protein Bbelb_085040 [Branchiostoma belcheri]|nr:hypothetical protein Bbelb_085040 [Branchiostoma belcheri]
MALTVVFLLALSLASTQADIQVRLADGGPNYGRVEVLHGHVWGTVCDDNFGKEDADVVCRDLGFPEATDVYTDAFYGPGAQSMPVWLDEVSCKGYESSLKFCSHDGWGVTNCDHAEDVSVKCLECKTVRISGSTTYQTNTMGTYTMTGETSGSRPVYAINSGINTYLHYVEAGSAWCVGPTLGVRLCGIEFADTSYYADEITATAEVFTGTPGQWVVSPQVQINCEGVTGATIDCNFDDDVCGYIAGHKTTNFTWTHWRGPTPSSGTGPGWDYPTGQGGYMYIETSIPRQPGDVARLVSPRVDVSGPSCLRFAYHMFGSSVGQLNVYVDNREAGWQLAWNQTGDMGSVWREDRVEVEGPGIQVVFEGISGDGESGDIAIDQIQLTNGPCPTACETIRIAGTPAQLGDLSGTYTMTGQIANARPVYANNAGNGLFLHFVATQEIWCLGPTVGTGNCAMYTPGQDQYAEEITEPFLFYSGGLWLVAQDVRITCESARDATFDCTFDGDLCGYTADRTASFLWTMNSGSTASPDTGPAGDFPTGAGKLAEHIPFTWTMNSTSGSTASPDTGPAGDFPTGAGKLALHITFTWTMNSGSTASLDTGPAGDFPTGAVVYPDTGPAGGFPAGAGKLSLYVTFTWTMNSGSTASPDTGPAGEFPTGAGQYMFIESSTPQQAGDTARLVSPEVTVQSPSCLHFAYHMFGGDIGQLNVYFRTDAGLSVKVWSLSGNQLNEWHDGAIDIAPQSLKVEFEGVVGNGYRGDISIDNIYLVDGPCPANDCTSDPCHNGATCTDLQTTGYTCQCAPGWIGETCDKGGIFYAYQHHSPNNNSNTSEVSQHIHIESPGHTVTLDKVRILDTEQDYFVRGVKEAVYIRAQPSLNRDGGRYRLPATFDALLTSSRFRLPENCVTVEVSGSAALQIDRMTSYTATGDMSGGRPVYGSNTLAGDFLHYLGADGVWCIGPTVGVYSCGAIVTDDHMFADEITGTFMLWDGTSWVSSPEVSIQCQSADASAGIDCTFDDGVCGYVMDHNADFTWDWWRYGTPTLNTGPTGDHTAFSGFYMYTEASGRQPGDVARMVSPRVDTTGHVCVRFNYHMFGSETGTLNVLIDDGLTGLRQVWHATGDQGNVWNEARLDAHGTSIQVVFEGVRGSGEQGDIAVDDIKMTDGTCPTGCSTVSLSGSTTMQVGMMGTYTRTGTSNGHPAYTSTSTNPQYYLHYIETNRGWCVGPAVGIPSCGIIVDDTSLYPEEITATFQLTDGSNWVPVPEVHITCGKGRGAKPRSQPAVRAFCPYVFWEATSATFFLKTWGRSGVDARHSHGCARCKCVVCTPRLAVSGCVHRSLRKWLRNDRHASDQEEDHGNVEFVPVRET